MNAGELILARDFSREAAVWIENAIASVLAERERASVALSGGTTPASVYRALATRMRVEWPRVDLYFADERCVPRDDPDSTFRLVLETLVDQVSGPPPVVHRMQGEVADHDAEARRYAALLPDPLDLVVLGMGSDGHTASLFPNHPLLGEWRRRVACVEDSPKPPRARLTVTPPVLAHARRLVVLVRGNDKAWALRAVLEGPEDARALPAQLALGGTWIVDDHAATELTARAR